MILLCSFNRKQINCAFVFYCFFSYCDPLLFVWFLFCIFNRNLQKYVFEASARCYIELGPSGTIASGKIASSKLWQKCGRRIRLTWLVCINKLYVSAKNVVTRERTFHLTQFYTLTKKQHSVVKVLEITLLSTTTSYGSSLQFFCSIKVIRFKNEIIHS